MRPIILLGAVLMALLGVTATLAYDTNDAGGPGGGKFRDRCPDGFVLTQILTSAGKDLNAVVGICNEVQNGQIVDQQRRLKQRGDMAQSIGSNFNGGDYYPPICTGNKAVGAITVLTSRHGTVHQFKVTCRDLGSGEEWITGLSQTNGGEGADVRAAACNSGDVAVGLRGHFGALIDSLGLICAPSPKPAPQEEAKPVEKKPPPPPKNGPGRVDNSGQGAEARVRADTTIYSDRISNNEIGYLDRGDAVSIVRCAGDWCEIDAPQQGWVWGPDLDR